MALLTLYLHARLLFISASWHWRSRCEMLSSQHWFPAVSLDLISVPTDVCLLFCPSWKPNILMNITNNSTHLHICWDTFIKQYILMCKHDFHMDALCLGFCPPLFVCCFCFLLLSDVHLWSFEKETSVFLLKADSCERRNISKGWHTVIPPVTSTNKHVLKSFSCQVLLPSDLPFYSFCSQCKFKSQSQTLQEPQTPAESDRRKETRETTVEGRCRVSYMH